MTKLYKIKLNTEMIEYVNAQSFSELLIKLQKEKIINSLDDLYSIEQLYEHVK